MTDIKFAFQSSQTLTNAIQSLASSPTWIAGYESATIDNTTNLYLDYIFDGIVTVGTTPTSGTEIRIYVVGSVDGTNWPTGFDGTTSSASMTTEGLRDSFAKLAAVLRVDAGTSNVAYNFTFTVANLFGGVVPPKFVLYTTHNSVAALNSTGGNQVFRYRGVYTTAL